MKLNPDCIRSVMLTLEKKLEYRINDDSLIERSALMLAQLCEELPDYKQEDIFYTLHNLEQAGYIKSTTKWQGNCVYLCAVYEITFQGHEFLNRVRDPKCWKAVKGGLSAIRNYSLDAINSIAGGITGAAIAAYFEKNPL